jgi:hypothetical protein
MKPTAPKKSLRKLFNVAAVTCLISSGVCAGTLIDIKKDYGTPPSQYFEYQEQQIKDGDRAIRSIFGPLALAAGALTLGLRKHRRRDLTA